MEGCCSLQSPTLAPIPTTSLTRVGEKTFIHGQSFRFPSFSKYPHPRKLKFVDVKAQSSGTAKFSAQAVDAIPKEDLKDENLAFVAGATGKVGSRTVRELLKLGFRVRAGVRSAQRAETLVQSVKQMQLNGEGAPPVERLEIVECDLEKPNQIGSALGNASVVLCCIGASEKEVFDITGPYRIDYQATKNLVDAATIAKVKHFIMVSSLGTNKVGFPAAILNLFWGVLIWKRKAEEALIASGVPYTIVRPGGMERPTDTYKETHNMTLSLEDTLFGGQVSNLQVAELIAFMAKNRGLSYCKVVEVIAETTAPLTPMDKLLEKIPSQRVEPKESVSAVVPETAPSESVISEAPSAPIETEPAEEKPVVTRPLSPYTAYEDLKPPSSPSPTPSGPKEMSFTGGNDLPKLVADAVAGNNLPLDSTSSNSPYQVYEDLKPPASPSPTAPAGSIMTGNSKPPTAPTVEQHNTEPKPRPLSPYTMYEDLKPPASPTPSPRK